eukprot:286181-Lingulodinium_polyedra.AAC.1
MRGCAETESLAAKEGAVIMAVRSTGMMLAASVHEPPCPVVVRRVGCLRRRSPVSSLHWGNLASSLPPFPALLILGLAPRVGDAGAAN